MRPLPRFSPFFLWLLFGIATRFIASLTHSTWNHPDEWFQTVEFAQLFVSGQMSFTQEVALHMRNLSWPALLAIPLGLAKTIAPDWIGLRIFLVEFFTGLLQLCAFWGWWKVMNSQFVRLPNSLKHFGAALFLAAWFVPADAIRPSQENLSAIAIWITLGLLAKKKWFWSGVLTVAIGAFKYPALLASLGIAFAVSADLLAQRASTRPFFKYFRGLLAGGVLFGIPDAMGYGRPWESLWMYLQYNVWTGLSASQFGTQSAAVYWEYFVGHWGRFLWPVFLLLGIGFGRSILQSLQKLQPWAYAFTFYLVGHLLVSHKEPRFMIPIESLFVYGGFVGLVSWENEKVRLWIRKLKWVWVFCGVVNALFFLKGLWGDTWKPAQTFFDLNRHLNDPSRTCAVVTVRKPLSLHLPSLPLAYFPSDRKVNSFEQTVNRPLIWIQKDAACEMDETVLIHLHKPAEAWTQHGCALLDSGVLRVLPRTKWDWAIEKDYASGVWYRCPATVLPLFQRPEVRKILADLGRAGDSR